MTTNNPALFGGNWTEKKLDILGRYLNAYTTAMKKQPFQLMYIDAFAGEGRIGLRDDKDGVGFLSGSSERALRTENRQFDRLVFVEKDPERCRELGLLRKKHPGRNVRIENTDANDYLRNLRENWNQWRGVLFLDPFAAQVEWSTIEAIARFKALDTWILFPVSAIARMLPNTRRPEDVSREWEARLNLVYGGDSWKALYGERRQGNLFGEIGYERDPGVDGLVKIYKKNLRNLFGDRFSNKSKVFTNSKNSPLFEFLFCVGHPKGVNVATGIADHLLKHD